MTPEWGRITVAEILPPIRGRLASGRGDLPVSGISTDSRKIEAGEIFWALKGENYDGHDFAGDALKAGASGVVASRNRFQYPEILPAPEGRYDSVAIIEVDDTLESLGDLARWWRRQYDTMVVGITGSVGKTTTKEMVAHILEQGGEILKSKGNFNNLIGLPLTLLLLTPGVTRAIVELGMNHPGEIARLTEISNPDIGLITNVAKVHLEGLGSIEAVAKAKWELVENMSPGGKVIINGDDRFLKNAARNLDGNVMTFGLGPGNDVGAGEVRHRTSEGSSFTLLYRGNAWPVRLGVPGLHNVMNGLAAASVGFASGSSPDHIVRGLEMFQGMKGRFETVSFPGGITLVDDTYNANPASLKAVLNVVASMVQGGRRLIVALGDMKELGGESVPEHRTAGRRVAGAGAAYFVALGDYAPEMIKGAIAAGLPRQRAFRVGSREEMVERLAYIVKEGDLVFIKGSRVMALEEVVQRLKRDVWVS
jgi:UDP-N-acetylmuramoyl-tripeptide--D-alanyl-D-alanine ligase